ncbi:MAG: CinA family protein [Candidatus Bipolaricaulota bacterium]|nr:MAG: CinA family protein [Candidatus Bipolaricaulota bacterium]
MSVGRTLRRGDSARGASGEGRSGLVKAEEWAEWLPRWAQRGVRVAVAESCTGGLLGAALTDPAGASAVFLGGVIAYDNRLKSELLGVPEELIHAHGAVSEPVARAMADGCRRRFACDVAVAVTGIAGPSGGTDSKPVGLVFVAIATPDGLCCRRFQWDGGREENRTRAVEAALDLMKEWFVAGDA